MSRKRELSEGHLRKERKAKVSPRTDSDHLLLLEKDLQDVAEELKKTRESMRMLTWELLLVESVVNWKADGSLGPDGGEWRACLSRFQLGGVEFLERDLPHMEKRCQNLALLDIPGLRVKESALVAKEADLRAEKARLDERMTMLMKDRQDLIVGRQPSSSPPNGAVQGSSDAVTLWLEEARRLFSMTEADILRVLECDWLNLPAVPELKQVPAMVGAAIPDFRRIPWVVQDGGLREGEMLSTATTILSNCRSHFERRKPFDVSVLVGVSGCGKTRTMFDIARGDYALYLDFGSKDVQGSEKNDIDFFLAVVIQTDNVPVLIGKLIVARLTAVILALETCKKRLLTPSEVLRLQLNGLSIQSRMLLRRLHSSSSYESIEADIGYLGLRLRELVASRLHSSATKTDVRSSNGACLLLLDEAGVLLNTLADRFPRLAPNSDDSRRRSLYHVFVEVAHKLSGFPIVIGGTMTSLLDLTDIVSRVADPTRSAVRSYVEYSMFEASSVRSFILKCLDVSDENRQDLELVSHVLAGRPRFAASFVLRYVELRTELLSPVRFLTVLVELVDTHRRNFRDPGSISSLLVNKFPFGKNADFVGRIWAHGCRDSRQQLVLAGQSSPSPSPSPSPLLYVPETAGLLPLSAVGDAVAPYVANEPLLEEACLEWFRCSGLNPIVCEFWSMASEKGSTFGTRFETVLGLYLCTMRFNGTSFGGRDDPLGLSTSDRLVPQVRAVRCVESSDRAYNVADGYSTASFLKMFPPGWCFVLPEQLFGPDGICILPVNDPLQSGEHKKSGFYVLFLGSKTTVSEANVPKRERDRNEKTVSVELIDASELKFVDEFKKYVRGLVPSIGKLHGFLCISVCLPTTILSPPVVRRKVRWDGKVTDEYLVTVHSDKCQAFLGEELGQKVLGRAKKSAQS